MGEAKARTPRHRASSGPGSGLQMRVAPLSGEIQSTDLRPPLPPAPGDGTHHRSPHLHSAGPPPQPAAASPYPALR